MINWSSTSDCARINQTSGRSTSRILKKSASLCGLVRETTTFRTRDKGYPNERKEIFRKLCSVNGIIFCFGLFKILLISFCVFKFLFMFFTVINCTWLNYLTILNSLLQAFLNVEKGKGGEATIALRRRIMQSTFRLSECIFVFASFLLLLSILALETPSPSFLFHFAWFSVLLVL